MTRYANPTQVFEYKFTPFLVDTGQELPLTQQHNCTYNYYKYVIIAKNIGSFALKLIYIYICYCFLHIYISHSHSPLWITSMLTDIHIYRFYSYKPIKYELS